MINIKEEKGITLITLVIAIVIMLVIASMLIYNGGTSLRTSVLNDMYNDITILKDRVDLYYARYGKIPVLDSKYENVPSSISEINVNDNGVYYVIKLEELDNLTLNYGKAYEKYKDNPKTGERDLYIINEQSHTIYYLKGINVDGKTYYTIPENNTKLEVETIACNHPKLIDGMTAVKVKQTQVMTVSQVNTSETDKQFEETQSYDPEWYEYLDTSIEGQEQKSKWANAKTKDGSMWVWIPRFAYKITEEGTNNGTIDVVFLKGTTNLDFDGNDVTSSDYINKDGIKGAYTVHPAFQNGTTNNYENGEWHGEIEGFWIAKFEAGYAGTENNSSSATDSDVAYSTELYHYETDSSGSAVTSATKTLNKNYYGIVTKDVTKIKYPTFQANHASMNNIGIEDAFDLCMSLKDSDVYGLKNVDSHLTKNSEWGAVVYLAYSKYGNNKIEPTHNNVSLNGGDNVLYAVTGCAKESDSDNVQTVTLSDVKSGAVANNWTTEQGKTASTTGNIYGVYDLNGGLWEWTAGYTYNEQVEETGEESNEYKSKYIQTENIALLYEGEEQLNRKGEAIWETSSKTGTTINAWNDNTFKFFDTTNIYSIRGGDWHENSNSGIFAFSCADTNCSYNIGFRAVLIEE